MAGKPLTKHVGRFATSPMKKFEATGVRRRTPAEDFAPVRAPSQSIGIVDRVAGLVAQDAHAPFVAAVFALAHDLALQPGEPWMREVERNREARDAVRAEPLRRQPDVRPEADAAALQLTPQPLDIGPDQAVLKPQAQAAESELQKRAVVVVGPAVIGQSWSFSCGVSHRSAMVPFGRISAPTPSTRCVSSPDST